jgi:hypothetical protein
MVRLLLVGHHNRLRPALSGRDTHPWHPSFQRQTLVVVSYTSEYNDQTYVDTNDNYKAPYTTIYTDPVPLPGGLVGRWPNYTNNDTMRYATYGPLDHGGYGYKTPPQIPFRPQLVEMTPTQATAEPCVESNNLATQFATIFRESFGMEPKGKGHVYQKPYPDYYDKVPYSRGYRVPEFPKFSGEDGL